MNRLGSLVRAARAGARLACQTSKEQQYEELGVRCVLILRLILHFHHNFLKERWIDEHIWP